MRELDALFSAKGTLHPLVSSCDTTLAAANKVLTLQLKQQGFGPIQHHFERPTFSQNVSLFADNPLHIFHVKNATEAKGLTPPTTGALILTANKKEVFKPLDWASNIIQLWPPDERAVNYFGQKYAAMTNQKPPAGFYADYVEVMNACDVGAQLPSGGVNHSTFSALKLVLQQKGDPKVLAQFQHDPVFLLGALKYMMRQNKQPVTSALLDIERDFKLGRAHAWEQFIGFILKMRGEHYAHLEQESQWP